MTTILSIDPGTTESAWLILRAGRPSTFATYPNDELLQHLRDRTFGHPIVPVIETIEPRYGVLMGRETIETAIWIGRFQEALHPRDVTLLKRSEILKHLGVVTSPRKGEVRVSADAGVRQALLDRYGGSKATAVGLKASPGPLFGISGDVWSALAVAVTYADQLEALAA